MIVMPHPPNDRLFGQHHLGYSPGYIFPGRTALDGPCDMDSLKAAISQAIPGTGQVKQAITSATFQPRAPAFTSLMQTCAKFRQLERCYEIFDAMQTSEAIVKPNTVHYSVLISACATAGKWEEAMQVFDSMKQAAATDPDCTPNTITYSSLISACAAGARLDKALQVYDEMQEAGLQPDHITYSTLISAYEKAGEPAEALALLDRLHESGGAASQDTYARVLQYLATKHLWNRALEVFLELQVAGVALTELLCLALLSVFEACGQSEQAQDVLQAASHAAIPLTSDLFNAVLRCCIAEQHGDRAVQIWHHMQAEGIQPNQASAEALFQACQGCPHLADTVAELTSQVASTAPFLSQASSIVPRQSSTPRAGTSAQQRTSEAKQQEAAASLYRRSGSSTSSTPRKSLPNLHWL